MALNLSTNALLRRSNVEIIERKMHYNCVRNVPILPDEYGSRVLGTYLISKSPNLIPYIRNNNVRIRRRYI